MGTKNLASGTLSETITTSSTTLLVYVGAGSASTIRGVFPTAPFYITVMPFAPNAGVANSLDSEIMLVTAVSNDQVGNVALTVTRAQRNTTAKAFNSGAIVTNGIYMDDIPLRLDYSLTEQNTGTKWIDGRTIYKKTISCGTLPNATDKIIEHGVDNLSRVIDAYGYAFRSSDGTGFPLIFTSNIAAANSIGFTWNSTTIVIGTGTDRSNITESYITIYYVKTS